MAISERVGRSDNSGRVYLVMTGNRQYWSLKSISAAAQSSVGMAGSSTRNRVAMSGKQFGADNANQIAVLGQGTEKN